MTDEEGDPTRQLSDELGEDVDTPEEASTPDTLETVLPSYAEDVLDKQETLDGVVLEPGLEDEIEMGFSYPFLSVRDGVEFEEMADEIDTVFEDYTQERRSVLSRMWEEDRTAVLYTAAGIGATGFLSGYALTQGLGGGEGFVAETVGAGTAGSMTYNGLRVLHEKYGPGDVVQGLRHIVTRGELPPSSPRVQRVDRARENLFLVNADHRELDFGDLEDVMEYDDELLEEMGVREELEELKTVGEDELADGCQYIRVVYDPTEDKEYLGEVVAESFDDHDIETYREAEEEGLAYSLG